MSALIHDPSFWVAVSFVIFVVLAWRPMKKAIAGALDERADKICRDLDEAVKLREEAQALLASYKRRQRDAENEVEEMLKNAKHEAERMREQAGRELEEMLKRREQQALDRIARAEADAVADVRRMAVELAIAATRRLLAENISEDRAAGLVDESIKQVEQKLH